MRSSNAPRQMWDRWLSALGFLTRIPAGRRHAAGPSLAEAVAAFPLVGLLIGAIGAAVYWLGTALSLGPVIAALLALAATMLVTGALHEDGLADTADGLGGGHGRDRKLEIMRDSALGSFGGLALMLSVLLRVAALAALAEPGLVAGALIASHAGARALLPAVMAWAPAARPDGLAAGAGRPAAGQVGLGLLIALLVVVIAAGFGPGLLALLLGWIAGLLLLAEARRQIGGHSGDILGAIEQVVEVVMLLTLVALA